MFVTWKSTEHGLQDIIYFFIRKWFFLEDIGNLFTSTREAAGISLKEVSEDLAIEEAILENIEDGRTGAFPDVFKLKKYVFNYAKYLGLDADKIIEEFNEYIFEATSKIPVKEIEKQVSEILKSEEESKEEKVISPYTKEEKKKINWLYLVTLIIVIGCFIFSIIWCFKQIVNKNESGILISERII